MQISSNQPANRPSLSIPTSRPSRPEPQAAGPVDGIGDSAQVSAESQSKCGHHQGATLIEGFNQNFQKGGCGHGRPSRDLLPSRPVPSAPQLTAPASTSAERCAPPQSLGTGTLRERLREADHNRCLANPFGVPVS
ncbi:MAG: hypothetical protein U0931_28965 [Vulcanimicrobiota bacterium]